MTTTEEIPQAARERLDSLGAADLVIALLTPSPTEALERLIRRARESVVRLYAPIRTVLLHAGEAPSDSSKDDFFRTVAIPSPAEPGAEPPIHTAFAVAGKMQARAVALIVSDPGDVTSEWIYRMVRPVLELDFDLVAPCYAHGAFEGLLNSGIVAPLVRALYGRRIEHPLGPDFGASGRLAQRFLETASPARDPRVPSLAVEAVVHGLEVCQARVGVRRYPHTDWMNQSAMIRSILGPLFREIELRAPFWQRIRGSQDVPTFSDAVPAPKLGDVPDTKALIQAFELGCQNLQEVWREVLPPGTLLELSRLARLGTDGFRFPAKLWARIVYDFALGHRLRILNPEHLLSAMTPLYLAWAASYALELPGRDRAEQLALAFEEAKPYALSRWRWPDRFNP